MAKAHPDRGKTQYLGIWYRLTVQYHVLLCKVMFSVAAPRFGYAGAFLVCAYVILVCIMCTT